MSIEKLYEKLSDGIGFTQCLIILVFIQGCLNCQDLTCIKRSVTEIKEECKK